MSNRRRIGKSLELGFMANHFLRGLGTVGESGMLEKMKNSSSKPLGYYEDTKEFKERVIEIKREMAKRREGDLR